ncbi:MAG: biopolymer transporter ExbD [Oligoflexus sp.]|nr:biopolymer transporter ExbD [Oligoflexus sp.]
MSSHKKRRGQNSGAGPETPELNVMPFIDVFSMLNIFLLVSASFLGLGILEVQIPFLSNSPDVKDPPKRSYSIRIDLEDAQVKVTSLWTAAPEEKNEKTFTYEPADIAKFHQEMIDLRVKVPENDKVTVYADNTVKYEQLIKVIDNVKTLKEKEPPLAIPGQEEKKGNQNFIFEKVIIGSVIL